MRATSDSPSTPIFPDDAFAAPALPPINPASATLRTPPSAPPRRTRLRIQTKTTLILLTMIILLVSAVGGIFLLASRSMLQESRRKQVAAFAYGLSTTLANDLQHPAGPSLNQKLAALAKTPNLQFVVLTNPQGKKTAALVEELAAWTRYAMYLDTSEGRAAGNLGRIRDVDEANSGSCGITVPVFAVDNGRDGALIGYLHASFDTREELGQLRFLQALVLITCMGGVLLAVPVASLISRHISDPIGRLAAGAHALADGDLSHRVSIARRDELGDLALAFNRMADTVESQQADIRRINAGLEQKILERTYEHAELNRRLQAEISEKEDFLRAVSHDLNAPLRNIAGMASMLAIKYQATLEKDALQRLDRIQKNVQIECELINELLELSRIKSRREKIETIDLHELLSAVIDGFDSDLETRGISLHVNARLPVMRCEKARMRQVFQNLIDNAIKYMRDAGPKSITISFDHLGRECRFSFADTGMGIAADELPHLFHVFRRAKNASVMKVPGKGVGLASVKSIIENYHGRLWAESVEGQGTTFHFSIPGSHFEAKEAVPA